MLWIALFECLSSLADVEFGCWLWGNCCLVNDCWFKAITWQWAFISFSAVAQWLLRRRVDCPCIVHAKNFAIVRGYCWLHIWAAAVTELDSMPVEDFIESVAWGEVLDDQREENFPNVCQHAGIIRRIEPYHIPLAWWAALLLSVVLNRLLETAVLKGTVWVWVYIF